MTESEYTALQSEREIITAVDLSNKEDRTLLFGVVYSPNEYVYHAYIKSGVIYSVTYPAVSPNTVEHRSINCDSDWMLAPVYAKHSDFEFVKLVLDCMRDMDVKKPYIKHPSLHIQSTTNSLCTMALCCQDIISNSMNKEANHERQCNRVP